MYDRLISRFLNLGNGRGYPTTDEGAKEYCANQTNHLSEDEGKAAYKYYDSLGPRFAHMFSTLKRPDAYDTLRWYCNSKNLGGELGKLLNEKASEAKQVRDTAIVTLESLDTSRTTMADVVCVIGLYATKVEAIFDSTQARDDVRKVTTFYREVANLTATESKTTDSGKCEFIAAPTDKVTLSTMTKSTFKQMTFDHIYVD
ncbi:unnamed protein product [Medioppia subpectinata]|uniref:Uncharacterized protein n=1 Tax=Medioppia subpectinata TaxID=1979941 RepID=A0A7R9KHP1_9ACAR|nr:unnamed protein product [Medioppia subpectinata]CAG2103560.1 unnamed protein product [Medioppia subpectinata]